MGILSKRVSQEGFFEFVTAQKSLCRWPGSKKASSGRARDLREYRREHEARLGCMPVISVEGTNVVDAAERIPPEDYVIRHTGESHSVREFVEIAFATLDWIIRNIA